MSALIFRRAIVVSTDGNCCLSWCVRKVWAGVQEVASPLSCSARIVLAGSVPCFVLFKFSRSSTFLRCHVRFWEWWVIEFLLWPPRHPLISAYLHDNQLTFWVWTSIVVVWYDGLQWWFLTTRRHVSLCRSSSRFERSSKTRSRELFVHRNQCFYSPIWWCNIDLMPWCVIMDSKMCDQNKYW